ncbi:hypothetical protein OAN22_02175 [Alphaproteobacteria bacterium]|nr:hypothetical protein [Alphaproteobacteria bacterium]
MLAQSIIFAASMEHRLKPVENIDIFHKSTEEAFEAIRGQLDLMEEVKDRPHVLAREDIDRMIRVYGEMNDQPDPLLLQCEQWRKEKLTPEQLEKVEKIECWTNEIHGLASKILKIAQSVKGKMITDIMEMSDEEIGLAALTGKLKSPH